MKRTFFTLMIFVLPYFSFAQEESLDVKICIRHRTDETSTKCLDYSGGNNTMEYLKDGLISSPRQYSIEIPSDCILAKVRIISKKDGVETQRREQSFSKSEKARSFGFDSNGRMGPYMKSKGEDTMEVQLLVYKRNATGDGYTKVPLTNTTFTINLTEERTLLAEKE